MLMSGTELLREKFAIASIPMQNDMYLFCCTSHPGQADQLEVKIMNAPFSQGPAGESTKLFLTGIPSVVDLSVQRKFGKRSAVHSSWRAVR